MTFTVRPAVREKIGLLFGIAGPSGSGKTFTALLLASGLANGTGKIGVIDTEASRALHYAPEPGQKADISKGTFEFLHLPFPPPFSPERYIDAIAEIEKEGATVIVIDSTTHEWEGEGGCSDIADAEAWRLAKGDASQVERYSAPSWKKPKKLHTRMMSRLIQTRSHLIFCLRAREKVKMVGGKVTPIGFQPLCEKNFMFELSGSMMLHPENPGCPDYGLPHKLNADLQAIFPDGSLISADAGRRLRHWAETGTDRPPEDKAISGARELIERVQDASEEGLTALLTDPETVKRRAWLTKHRPQLANQVDVAIERANAVFEIGTQPADAPSTMEP